MKIFGKNIPTDKINFCMNCVSFVLGIIFFIRMQIKMSEVPTSVSFASEHDSLVRIETRISLQLKELKVIQDSITRSIKESKNLLNQKANAVNVKRKELITTVQTDWDDLHPSDQDRYVNQLLSNIKQKQK